MQEREKDLRGSQYFNFTNLEQNSPIPLINFCVFPIILSIFSKNKVYKKNCIFVHLYL